MINMFGYSVSNNIYSLIEDNIRRNNFNEAFLQFKDIYEEHWPIKRKRNNDNMYLFLFNFILDLPRDYQDIAKGLKPADFCLDEKEITEINNGKLSRAIFNRRFDAAIKVLIDSKPVVGKCSSKESILLGLLNAANNKQKEDNRSLFELIRQKDYDKAKVFLEEKRLKRGISIAERHTIYLIQKLSAITDTSLVPKSSTMHKESVFSAITSNNYDIALDMEKVHCNKRGINPKNDCLYILLEQVSEEVKKNQLGSTGKANHSVKISDELLTRASSYAPSELTTYRVCRDNNELFGKKLLSDQSLGKLSYCKILV